MNPGCRILRHGQKGSGTCSDPGMNADPPRPCSVHPTDLTLTQPEIKSSSTTTYRIRPLTSEAELIQSQRLRYDVYSAGLGYIPPSQSCLEIDQYDSASIALGALDEAGKMLGTLRIIGTDRKPRQDRLIRDILNDAGDPELICRASGPRRFPLPLPSVTSDDIRREIEDMSDGLPIVELSRLIVLPGHRYSGLDRGLVFLGIALAAKSGPVVLVGGCLPEHVRLYARYGFVRLAGNGTGTKHHASVDRDGVTIACLTNQLPGNVQAVVDAILRAYAAGSVEYASPISRDGIALYQFGEGSQDTQEVT